MDNIVATEEETAQLENVSCAGRWGPEPFASTLSARGTARTHREATGSIPCAIESKLRPATLSPPPHTASTWAVGVKPVFFPTHAHAVDLYTKILTNTVFSG